MDAGSGITDVWHGGPFSSDANVCRMTIVCLTAASQLGMAANVQLPTAQIVHMFQQSQEGVG